MLLISEHISKDTLILAFDGRSMLSKRKYNSKDTLFITVNGRSMLILLIKRCEIFVILNKLIAVHLHI